MKNEVFNENSGDFDQKTFLEGSKNLTQYSSLSYIGHLTPDMGRNKCEVSQILPSDDNFSYDFSEDIKYL